MKSQEVRERFFRFFEARKHTVVPSAPMVVKDDPTLMFTNAGMNQFKEYFLGNRKPVSARVTDTQKCLRVSGKHNDLEEVGKDTYHHTMFEMLGNWSFGDYFKKEAIGWAWELLTEVFGIDRERLYVTYFEGAADDNLPEDGEAKTLWEAIVPADRVLPGNKNDNFWEMGEQGPCGPCSEIHIDIRTDEERKKVPGSALVNKDHPQVVEIWNLVFMEFNRKADGSLEKLPARHVDTGMGFERLCMVLQGVKSNYDTDVFTPIIREIEAVTTSKYGKDEKTDIAIRVVADHLRAVAFAIADGQLPSNTGAGYVIRRILRRAIRYGFTFLGQDEPFIYKLVDTLSSQMHHAFPEIKAQKNLVVNVIREEEQSFLKTLEQGLVLLDSIISNAKDHTISGSKAFELYDTYGFPIDLTALILGERGYALDEEGFRKELQKQKDRSRAATAVSTGDWVVLSEDDEEEFVGYDTLETRVRITRYRKVNSKKDGEMYQVVFNLTPFYPEGGGQVGDKGYIKAANGDVVYITDTRKENNLIIHLTKNLPRNTEGSFTAVVDANQRRRTSANHSATHLLHQALRVVLGEHVEQKGSSVHNNHLRFDFSHFSRMTQEELQQVEDFVNARIREQLPLEEHRNTPYQQALEAGAMALFGEKYGDTVRTVRFGESMELCGGTHVKNTGDIWHFIITGEGAVAAGIRRIEAITLDAAKEYFTSQAEIFGEVKAALRNTSDPVKAITALQEENSALKKQLEALMKDKAGNLKKELAGSFEHIGNVRFLATTVDLDTPAVKDLVFELGREHENLFVLLATEQQGKAVLTCYISKELASERDLNAGKVVRELGKYINGGGGGQPFFATAGGKRPEGIPEALEHARTFIASK
ncbi:alanine--tRNA ligase [Sinomicrobium soli]|uniref:alanine--tRNA ligase n=1 Tax=Sinomicrobium sp. N-1-3-6 TaxID=2219864 RepID=UPI000DCE6106|nr:alanine--tRNA ligase [Sinomicrobium sp. N-1-3-6]RAV30730.1 alanine--tRNA ligase [Sinomicrobium sp. N-1-3-6]